MLLIFENMLPWIDVFHPSLSCASSRHAQSFLCLVKMTGFHSPNCIMAEVKAILLVLFVASFPFSESTSCYSSYSSYCYGSQTCCHDNVCRYTCTCSYDSQCSGANECCRNGICTKSCSDASGVIAGIISTLVFVGIVVSVAVCCCCACCPCYRYRNTGGRVIVTAPANQATVIATTTTHT